MSTHVAEEPSRLPECARTALGLAPSGPHYSFYRHSLWVRVSHWVNAICLAILLMSGLNIFNAHPALYWGNASDFDHPAVMVGAMVNDQDEISAGFVSVGAHHFDTTGVLGASRVNGELTMRGFPSWATLPAPTGWPWRGNGTSPSPGCWCSTRRSSSPMGC